jgi:hypothetical protein
MGAKCSGLNESMLGCRSSFSVEKNRTNDDNGAVISGFLYRDRLNSLLLCWLAFTLFTRADGFPSSFFIHSLRVLRIAFKLFERESKAEASNM